MRDLLDAPDLVLLGEAGGCDTALLGGKASALRRLIEAGFHVPEAAVVTTAAFLRALAAGGSRHQLGALLGALDPEDPEALASQAAALHQLVLALPYPEGLEGAITARAQALDGGAGLAVRSSATCEDLPDASFAGQHETYLGVPVEGVAAAVRQVWASIYSPRALAYRLSMGFLAGGTLPAVLIQRQLAPEVSGVVFTADPTTGNPDRLLVSACPGLGEGLVGGRVEPDEIHLDRSGAAPPTVRLGAKASRLVLAPGGGIQEIPADPEQAAGPCLEGFALEQLVATSLAVEEALGGPQDIEWCRAAGSLWMLQARPVTTRLHRPEDEGHEGYADIYVYGHGNFAETMPDPPSPYGWALLEGLAYQVFNVLDLRFPDAQGYRLFRLVHGRPYWDLTPLFLGPALQDRLLLGLRLTDHFTAGALRRVAQEHPPRARPLFSLGGGLWLLAQLVVRLPLLALRLLPITWDPAAALRRIDDTIDRSLEELRRLRPATPSPEAEARYLRLIRTTLSRVFVGPPRILFSAMGASVGALVLLARAWLPDRFADTELLEMAAGPRGNRTHEAGNELWELSRHLGEDPESRAVLLRGDAGDALARLEETRPEAPATAWLRAYLERWGHRGPGEQDIARARWYEDPGPLIEALRAALGAPDGDPEGRRRTSLATRVRLLADAEAALRAAAWVPALPLRAWVFGWLVRHLHQLFPVREDAKHQALRFMRLLKETLTRLGPALVASGHLRRADDVFEFAPAELEAWIEAGMPDPEQVRARLLRRRLERQRHARLEAPLVQLSNGVAYHQPFEDAGAALRGEGASPGVVRGIVRILDHPRQAARLGPGEVLVTRLTDPAWTPLFLVAGALVMEVGGVASHGATVAREYGIPAVVGAREATRRLRDGQRVLVDGGRGLVVPEDPSPGEA